MRSGVKTVSFDDRKVLLGVIAHYATLHQRVQIITPRGIAEEFASEEKRIEKKRIEEKRICLFCKKVELTQRQKKYCSQVCSSRHQVDLGTGKRKPITARFCKNKECNKEFTPALNRTVFCSVACAKHVTKNPKIVCKNPECAKEFKPHDKSSRYCSISCANIMRAIKDKQCANANCKKLFKPKEKPQKFCCLKCSGESKRKNNGTR